jgi:hydrogenase expression/formation protein HypD
MKYVDEFRNLEIAKRVSKEIRRRLEDEYRIMEVCGTHTQTIFRYGLKSLLPRGIKLLSGPGCPICVSPVDFVDKAIYYSRLKDFIVTTFGDMLKVPGSGSSLEKERAKAKDIRVVYSSLDALDIAVKNPYKKIVFLGIGFETTAPTIAATILEAEKRKIDNFFVLCGHKVMPPALKALVGDRKLNIDAFILPAHVSTIIGSKPYTFIADKFGIDCVIAGFEPLDVLQGIHMLVSSRVKGMRPGVKIQYRRVVKKDGNKKAVGIVEKVFGVSSSRWRGIGDIPGSGLKIGKEFRRFDIESYKRPDIPRSKENPLCICGQILKGMKSPSECSLFGRACKPERPIGACMVSSEGTCATHYKYGEKRWIR